MLLLSCVLFHFHYAGPAGVMPIIALAVLTYSAGRSRDRRLCLAAMVICVAALVLYKYTKFICSSVIGFFAPTCGNALFVVVQPLIPSSPPLAISFFIFEFIHYLFEIRNGREPIRSAFQFALFSIFWPTLVCGPIKRYQQFVPSLEAALQERANCQRIGQGLFRVCFGLGQKFIADSLAIYIRSVDERLDSLALISRWLFLVALVLRLYFDFAGYSDIAIGYARIMGVTVPENFNWPYLSTSLVDFWRRWHISLSTWVRDYIYVPLGGSRYSPIRTVFNALCAFIFCGLWHGAAWNFVIWGIYNGIGVVVNSRYAKAGKLGKTVQQVMAHSPQLAWAVNLMYISIGIVVFSYPLEKAIRILHSLFVP